MKVRSKEITYQIVIEQVFFEDDTELVIKTGWTESGSDYDLELIWVEGKPDWADKMTDEEVLKLTEEK
jgi:hypothetical protein